mgnify:CR=1 FL=1
MARMSIDTHKTKGRIKEYYNNARPPHSMDTSTNILVRKNLKKKKKKRGGLNLFEKKRGEICCFAKMTTLAKVRL